MSVFTVQSVGTNTVRWIVPGSTDATVEKSSIRCLIRGSCHTPVAKSVAAHWGQIVDICAIFSVIQVTDWSRNHVIIYISKWLVLL